MCAQKWQPGRKSEPRESCFRWERLESEGCFRFCEEQNKKPVEGLAKREPKQEGASGDRARRMVGTVLRQKGLLEGKEEMCSFAKVSLEQRAPVESQNRGRMNEEISSITGYPTAREQRRGSGGWKVARAGEMSWGTCREPGTEERSYFVLFQQWP